MSNVMIGAVKSDEIENSNYLTPSKKIIDSWSKKQAFEWLNDQYSKMYNAQVSNKDYELTALSESEKAVRDYLVKKRKTWFKKK
jgi:hypothetical protein